MKLNEERRAIVLKQEKAKLGLLPCKGAEEKDDSKDHYWKDLRLRAMAYSLPPQKSKTYTSHLARTPKNQPAYDKQRQF